MSTSFIKQFIAPIVVAVLMAGCAIIPEQRILYTPRDQKLDPGVQEEECAKIHIPKPPMKPKITRKDIEALPPNALDRAIQAFIAKQDDHIDKLERIIHAARIQVWKCQNGDL